MYESTSTLFQSELDYRAARIRSSFGPRRQRRWTRTRRTSEASHAR